MSYNEVTFFFYNQKLDLDLFHVKLRFFLFYVTLYQSYSLLKKIHVCSIFGFGFSFKNMQYAAKDIPENIFIDFYTLAEPNFIFFSMAMDQHQESEEYKSPDLMFCYSVWF